MLYYIRLYDSLLHYMIISCNIISDLFKVVYHIILMSASRGPGASPRTPPRDLEYISRNRKDNLE